MPKIIDGQDTSSINTAVHALSSGHIIALPTETVYGLAADAANEQAIQKIFQAKKRPIFNPLICHIHPDFDLSRYVKITPQAQQLMDIFWPGPLTIIFELKKHAPIAPSVTAGLSSIALRAPKHPIFQQILKSFKHPIAAPSANRSGGLSPTKAQHVYDSLKENDIFIIDGGSSRSGIESTIIDARSPTLKLLRYGVISLSEIEQASKNIIEIATKPKSNEPIQSPGQILRHYAPKKHIRLNVTKPNPNETWLSFGSNHHRHIYELNLSPKEDLSEVAANLFSFLWQADQSDTLSIAVAPIPHIGIGISINDRLQKAACEFQTS